MDRYEAVQCLASIVDEDALVITSLGAVAHEWYSVMPGDGSLFSQLLGCATPFALGVAIALPHRKVIALDGDGSALFNSSALCTVGNERPSNLTIIVFDNEVHAGFFQHGRLHRTHTQGNVDLEKIASGSGIPVTATVTDSGSFAARVREMLDDEEVGFLVAKVEPKVASIPSDRVKQSDSIEDKYRFIRYIERTEQVSIRPLYVNKSRAE